MEEHPCVYVDSDRSERVWNVIFSLNIFLEEGMAIHSSILAWRILWMEEPGRLQSIGLHRVRHD